MTWIVLTECLIHAVFRRVIKVEKKCVAGDGRGVRPPRSLRKSFTSFFMAVLAGSSLLVVHDGGGREEQEEGKKEEGE